MWLKNLSILSLKELWHMDFILSHPSCISVKLMLLVSMLILLLVGIYCGPSIWVSDIVWLPYFWRMAVVFARVICSENANKTAVRLLLETLVHLWLFHALILGIKIPALCWSEHYRLIVEFHHFAVGIIYKNFVCILLLRPRSLSLRALAPCNTGRRTEWKERVVWL